MLDSSVSGIPHINQLAGLALDACNSCQNVIEQVIAVLYFVHKCFLQFIPLRENDIGSDQENVVAR
jgi:hypothetical protein